jgi:hypothetical protein
VDQIAWPSGLYGDVYLAVRASLAPAVPPVAPGIDAKIGRMIDFLRVRGDTQALKILEAISVNIERVRHETPSKASPAPARARAELARLSKDWQAASPIFPVQ